MWRRTLSQIILVPRLTHMVIGMAVVLLVMRLGAVAEQATKTGDQGPQKESHKEEKKEGASESVEKKEAPKKEEDAKKEVAKKEETKKDASLKEPDSSKDAKKEESTPEHKKDGEKKEEHAKNDDPAKMDKIDPLLLDETQIKTLISLAERRKEIQKEEVEIKKRKALIALSEKKIGEQLAKLEKVKEYIDQNKPVGMASPEENTKKMVKVYEGMKPQAAAQIFNKMRMETLIQVVQGMSQKKVAGILAVMDPDRARELTIRMTSIGVPIAEVHHKK